MQTIRGPLILQCQGGCGKTVTLLSEVIVRNGRPWACQKLPEGWHRLVTDSTIPTECWERPGVIIDACPTCSKKYLELPCAIDLPLE
jgi:hypothetical protein